MLAIVDYGMGNLYSLANALRRVAPDARIARSPGALRGARGVVLPGVGAFGDGMRNLRPWRPALRRALDGGRPLLGICLGMQMLFDSSEESPGARGLGVLPGEVRRIRGKVRVPQMGWNVVAPVRRDTLFQGVPRGSRFYFAHSYHCVPRRRGDRLAEVDYGWGLCAAVQRGGVRGVQFHPEKSGPLGLRVLGNFSRLCDGGG
ncbi:MAG: imidazole glycerol phosphate synthase subunit HisH [Euryarchaeota archaeon]|nr:imidazole glycerol phosphate synthase subunit HisH [Euryarchaeota archaeon]